MFAFYNSRDLTVIVCKMFPETKFSTHARQAQVAHIVDVHFVDQT